MNPLRFLSVLLSAMLMLSLVACALTTTTDAPAAEPVDEAAGEVEEAAGEVEEAAEETGEEVAEAGAGLGRTPPPWPSEFFSQADLDIATSSLIDAAPMGRRANPGSST